MTVNTPPKVNNTNSSKEPELKANLYMYQPKNTFARGKWCMQGVRIYEKDIYQQSDRKLEKSDLSLLNTENMFKNN